MLNVGKHLPKSSGFDLDRIIVSPDEKIKFPGDFDPDYHGEFKDKAATEIELQSNIQELAAQQDVLYANGTYALLIIFQALDAAGKDSTIKHVMTGVNPQGCQVYNFKAPSTEELNHDYLWRTTRCLPERGRIGIFNRSYYEEVLVVRVHPEALAKQRLPGDQDGIWKQRFRDINNFEQYLTANGIVVLKFYLNVSKKEQKKRFLKRIEDKEKNWKFSASDVRERKFWPQYMEAYADAFSGTSTEWAPWFVIPADHKWFTRLCVSEIVVAALKSLSLSYPKVPKEVADELEKAKQELLKEKG
jgi:PPK2 family polyphosphate:nucleotide phosphotransferase